MRLTDASKALQLMESKRVALMDQCTRALCGDKAVNAKMLDEATGGRYSSEEDANVKNAVISCMLLTLRHLGDVPEKKIRRKRQARTIKEGDVAATPGNGVAKKRGRPSAKKDKPAEQAPEATPSA